MVGMSSSGSVEGPGWATVSGYPISGDSGPEEWRNGNPPPVERVPAGPAGDAKTLRTSASNTNGGASSARR